MTVGAGALEGEKKMKGLPLVFLGHRQYYDGYDSIVLLVGTGCVHVCGHHVWLVCYLLVMRVQVLPSKLDLQEHQQDRQDKHHGLQLHAEDNLQSGLQCLVTLSCYN